jgi:hypothetical protein
LLHPQQPLGWCGGRAGARHVFHGEVNSLHEGACLLARHQVRVFGRKTRTVRTSWKSEIRRTKQIRSSNAKGSKQHRPADPACMRARWHGGMCWWVCFGHSDLGIPLNVNLGDTDPHKRFFFGLLNALSLSIGTGQMGNAREERGIRAERLTRCGYGLEMRAAVVAVAARILWISRAMILAPSALGCRWSPKWLSFRREQMSASGRPRRSQKSFSRGL